MTIRRLTAAAIAALLAVTTMTATVSAFPPEDTRYLDHGEMAAAVREIAARKPGIARVFSIGTSYEGRELWAATVSDRVGVDEDEPEVLFDGGMHGREHMSTEMAVALFRNLVDGHGTDRRITELVNETEITILFSLNPDGSEYDHASGTILSWRKNRQPTPGSSEIGTDINRNFGYHWGTNPLNASPSAWTYRGPAPWSTPEASAFKRYVEGRVIDGEQQIRVHVTFHQHGRIVLYPYGYTTEAIPPDMDADDHVRLRAMATEMARLSGYDVGQSSSGEIHVGNQMDWLYGTYRILTFTIEMGDAFHMPAHAIPTETGRSMEAAYYAIEQASLMADADRRRGSIRPPSTVPSVHGLFCF
jgi:carboxypeptidase T